MNVCIEKTPETGKPHFRIKEFPKCELRERAVFSLYRYSEYKEDWVLVEGFNCYSMDEMREKIREFVKNSPKEYDVYISHGH